MSAMAARRSPTEVEGPRRPLDAPRRSRYLVAAVLFVAGLALAVGVELAVGQAMSDQAQGFARADIPGALTFRVDRPGTYDVYAEGTVCLDYPDCHGQLYPVTVEVTGPGGIAVTTEPADGPTYMTGSTQGTGIATFDATTPGLYRVAARTGPYAEGRIAVGGAFPWWTGDLPAWSVLGLLWAGGVAVIVVPIVATRRRRSAR